MDYSKFIVTDVDQRLTPVNKLIDDMYTRLEEFQTMISFAKQERISATVELTSLLNCQENLADLFLRIDSVENLMEHVKSILYSLERDMDKIEEELGYPESTIKVASMFLFKKNLEKKDMVTSPQNYKTSDYFSANDVSQPNECSKTEEI